MQSFVVRAWLGAVVLFFVLMLVSSYAFAPNDTDVSDVKMAGTPQTTVWEDQYFCDALLWPEEDEQCQHGTFLSNKGHGFSHVMNRVLTGIKI